ncbi:winged helix-turn-helix domain-containing protein [Dokdonella sp.]|uniref:winged helix-turn-helix domain-containing protein n=1 Tax=Dokdonella sp. TaxID=2291710 RepID=UPI0035297AE6
MRYRFSGFVLDQDERRLLDPEGREVPCAPKTLDALLLMVELNGQLVSRETFHERLWARSVVADDTLGKLVWHVRKALAPFGEDLIETVPKHGYRFHGDVVGERSKPLEPAISCEVDVAASRGRLGWILALCIAACLVAAVIHFHSSSTDGQTAALSGASESEGYVAVAVAESSPELPQWVGEMLGTAIALDLGIELAGSSSFPVSDIAIGRSGRLLRHKVSSDGSGRWIWSIDPGQERQILTLVIDKDSDLRKQVHNAVDRLRAAASLPLIGRSQGAARDLVLPRTWTSLRAYVSASQALMRRQGQSAESALAPVVIGEPEFLPAWLSLARAQYLQAQDAESAKSAREGLARAAQAPAILRLALEVQLDEAEGRFDEAAERSYAMYLLKPERYDTTLTAARLTGHTGQADRFDFLIAHARELRPDLPEVDLLESVIRLRRGQLEQATAAAASASAKALALGWKEIAAEAMLNEARALGQQTDYERALEQVRKARELIEAPQPDLLAQLALVEGSVLTDLQRYDEALQSLAIAESWFRSSQADFELSSVLDRQREIAIRRGDKAHAAALADESLRLAEASGDRYLAVAFSIRIANTFLDSGEAAIANEWFSQAVERASQVNNPRLLASTLIDWAKGAWQVGATEVARSASTKGLDTALSSQDWGAASSAALLAAKIALDQEDAESAERLMDQAQDFAQRTDDPFSIAQVLVGHAELSLVCSDPGRAQAYLEDARRSIVLLAETPGAAVDMAEIELSVSLLEAERALLEGQRDSAESSLSESERLITRSSTEEKRVMAILLRSMQRSVAGNRTEAKTLLDSLDGLALQGQNRMDGIRQRLVRALESGEVLRLRNPPPASCKAAK